MADLVVLVVLSAVVLTVAGTVAVAVRRFNRAADDVEMIVYRRAREAFERIFE